MFFSRFRRSAPAPVQDDILAYCEKIRDAKRTERPDLHELANSIDITISAKPMRGDLCGWIAPHGDSWHITYNGNHKLSRQRFTIAHLIGHHFYHRDLMRPWNGIGGANDNLSYEQIRNAPYHNPLILPHHENQANRFAVSLLMPASIIRRMANDGLTVFQIADRLAMSVQTTAIRLRSLKQPAL